MATIVLLDSFTSFVSCSSVAVILCAFCTCGMCPSIFLFILPVFHFPSIILLPCPISHWLTHSLSIPIFLYSILALTFLPPTHVQSSRRPSCCLTERVMARSATVSVETSCGPWVRTRSTPKCSRSWATPKLRVRQTGWVGLILITFSTIKYRLNCEEDHVLSATLLNKAVQTNVRGIVLSPPVPKERHATLR